MWVAQVKELRSVEGVLLGVSKLGSIFFLSLINSFERAVPTSLAVNPTPAKIVPLKMKVPNQLAKVKEPGSNKWLLGQLAKMAKWLVVMVDGDG